MHDGDQLHASKSSFLPGNWLLVAGKKIIFWYGLQVLCAALVVSLGTSSFRMTLVHFVVYAAKDFYWRKYAGLAMCVGLLVPWLVVVAMAQVHCAANPWLHTCASEQVYILRPLGAAVIVSLGTSSYFYVFISVTGNFPDNIIELFGAINH